MESIKLNVNVPNYAAHARVGQVDLSPAELASGKYQPLIDPKSKQQVMTSDEPPKPVYVSADIKKDLEYLLAKPGSAVKVAAAGTWDKVRESLIPELFLQNWSN